MKKHLLGVLVVMCMLVGLIPQIGAKAETTICTEYRGDNSEDQNYSRWANPIGSYLTYCEDGRIMRVQAGSYNTSGVIVEYYDTAYNLLSTRVIDSELPIFGGFYAADNAYFLLTGQSNSEESASKEVYRITKFDKNWNRITSSGLYDCNTTVPFDAGSARFDVSGKYLLIRTSHEMYTTSDGLNHQANVTIQVDMDTAAITDSYTVIMNNRMGYVSHSFNQFIKVENGHIVAVDHGDASPRSIVLMKYNTDVSTGKFVPDYWKTPCTNIDIMTFPGRSGENVTGAAIGGFEISNSSYLVAGHSVIQDDSNLTRTTRNIFVASVSKTTSNVNINWITSYAEGDGTTSTPQFVKINDNKFILLWSRDDVVYYTEIDGNGSQTGSIHTLDGNLSDCVPIVINNKLVWYVWVNESVKFYEISLADLDNTNVTEVSNAHDYQSTGIVDGYVQLVCSRCGKTDEVIAVTSFTPYWKYPDKTGYWSNAPVKEQLIGSEYGMWIGSYGPSGASLDLVIESSDPSVVKCSKDTSTGIQLMYIVKMVGKGTATLKMYPKYNPDIARTYTFEVNDHFHDYAPTGEIRDGYAISSCTICGDEISTLVATSMSIYWNTNGGYSYSSVFSNPMDVDTKLYYWVNSVSPSGANNDIEVVVENPEIATWTRTSNSMGYLTMLKSGQTNITFRPKLNPSCTRTYTIKVNGDFAIQSFTADKESPQFYGSQINLSAVAAGGTWSYKYKFYAVDSAGQTTVIKDYSTKASCTWIPEKAGHYTLYTDIMNGDNVLTQSMEYDINDLALTRVSVVLENDISALFKAPAVIDSKYHDCYIEVVKKKDDGITETTTVEGVKSSDGKYYEFMYSGIKANEIVDMLDITIYAYDEAGNLVQGRTKENYSIKDYCMSMLNKNDQQLEASGVVGVKKTQLRTLMVDLLNYSAEAQIYSKYKTNNLVNKDLTDEHMKYASDDSVLSGLKNITDKNYNTIDNPSAQWNSVVLIMLNRVVVRLKFSYSGDISDVKMIASIDGSNSYEITEFEDLGNGAYYVYVDQIKACQMSKPVYFTLKSGEQVISNTLSYSVESYIAKSLDKEDVGRMVSAMMKYGKAAEAYSAK